VSPSSRERWRFATLASVAVLVALFAGGRQLYDTVRRTSFVVGGEQDRPVRVTDLGMLPPETAESSGLAVSRIHPRTFWTHNDSGDRPRIYALDSGAVLRATYRVSGVRAQDWEALDIGPCPPGLGTGGSCLYIGDTGDNNERRPRVRIHVVEEPDPSRPEGEIPALATVELRYVGGSADVEALAVAPDGTVVLVTKGRSGEVWLYRLAPDELARAASSGETLLSTDRTRLPIEPSFMVGRWVTGASIDDGGTWLALRTYTEVYFYAWPVTEPAEEPRVTCFLGGLEPNGEAIAFSGDGRVYVTSESPGALAGHLLEIECRGVRD